MELEKDSAKGEIAPSGRSASKESPLIKQSAAILEDTPPNQIELEKDSVKGPITPSERSASNESPLVQKSSSTILPADTHWKKICETLLSQINKLNSNVKNCKIVVSQMDAYIHSLEHEYGILEKELQADIQMLEKKTDNLISDIAGKEQDKKKEALLELEDAIQEVRSMRESLSESETRKNSAEAAVTKAVSDIVRLAITLSQKRVSDKNLDFEELLRHISAEDTDWKQVCDDLQKKIDELSENQNHSKELFSKTRDHAKSLEERYNKLYKELEGKIQSMKKKARNLIPGVPNEELDKKSEEILKSKDDLLHPEALAEVSSIKRTLSKSKTPSKVCIYLQTHNNFLIIRVSCYC